MKSVEQNCVVHAKHNQSLMCLMLQWLVSYIALAACCAHRIVQHLMIVLLCTGELGKHDKLPTKHIHEKNFHNTLVFHKPPPVFVIAQIHLLVICQRISTDFIPDVRKFHVILFSFTFTLYLFCVLMTVTGICTLKMSET